MGKGPFSLFLESLRYIRKENSIGQKEILGKLHEFKEIAKNYNWEWAYIEYMYLCLLSPAFSKKSGGTLFLVFRGAWRVVRGAWRVVRGSEFLVGTLSP